MRRLEKRKKILTVGLARIKIQKHCFINEHITRENCQEMSLGAKKTGT